MAQVSLTALDTAYTQNFDTLPTSGSATWTNNSTIPGWYSVRTGTGTTIVANDGSSNAGNLYSYGTGTATDRALGTIGSANAAAGSFFHGVRLANNTGATITSLDVAYVGEQWRNSAAAAQTMAFSYLVGSPAVTGSLAEFQSAGVAVNTLDFTSPVTGGVAAALNGNLAANRTAKTITISGLSIPNGTEVMLRWSDPDQTGSDHGLSIDDFSVTPHGTGGGGPTLSINDVSHNEGDTGTTTYTFTVSLSAAAATNVTFDIATADGTATAPSDYTANSLTAQTILAGNTTYTFDVQVNGDTTTEANETFFVNLTNASGATIADAQGVGTIVNDDVTIIKIHDVQGNGSATPMPGATVSVEGVVTANFLGTSKLSGFFLQEEDADADADPNTSEGIFVLCGACAANAVAEGQRVRVTGTVSEFQGMTELTSATVAGVVVTDAGNHLAEVTPSPITLPISGDVDAFYEAREGMLITYTNTLTVSEYFQLFRFGQIELVEGDRPRTFTEDNVPDVAGYAAHLDALARRHVILDDDNNSQEAPLSQPNGNQAVYYPQANGGFSVGTQGVDFFRGGDQVNNLTGVLQWSWPGFGANTWRVRPTAAHPVAFTVANPRPVTPPNVGGSIRAVGMNLLNYFTTIDTTASSSSGPCGPSGTLDCRGADSVAELNRQRERASIVVCTLNPDVASFMELENTTPADTINDLLGAVNARCGGAHPYAFVNTGGTLGTDAIRVMQVYRQGILSPVGSPLVDLDPVHNRPPTAQTYDVVDAANTAFGKRFTVIANHFKSKGSCPTSGADVDQNDGQACWAATRTAQASRLLTWINGTVIPAAGDPDVLLLGDFNAYAHETPVTTLEAGGYHDMETDLHGTNAYSYLFSGELGHLDYAFASNSMVSQITGADAWHINADEVDLFDYNDEVLDVGEATFEEKPDGSALVPPRVVFQPATPYRASDHDPVVVGLFGAPSSDLSATVVDTPDPVVAGNNLTYTVTMTNNGPDTASSAAWTDTLPAGAGFVSLSSPAGWSCTTPAVGAGGVVSCTQPAFAVGSAVFTLTVAVAPTVAAGTVLSNSATITAGTSDPTPGNNTGTATTTVAASADLSTTVADSPDPVVAGNNLTYTITQTNAGPSNAATVSLSDTLPSGTTFISLVTPTGWSCTNPGVGSAGTISCTSASVPVGSAVFTLVVKVGAGVAGGTVISNTATVSSATTDPNPGNESGTTTTTVQAAPQGNLTIAPTAAAFGNQIVGTTSAAMTVTLGNNGSASLDVTALTAATTPFARLGGTCSGGVPITIAPSGSCTLTYTFAPTATGAAAQTLTVTANAPGSGTIALSGTGVQGQLTITPTTLAFGNQPISTAGFLTVTLGNSGNAPLSVTGLTNATAPFLQVGGGTCSSLPISIAAGGSCTLRYQFSPTVLGPANQVLTVTANAPGGGTITLSGNGTPAEADVSLTITDGRQFVQVGDTLNYVITVTNATGPGVATVTVGDALPASLSGGTWICTPSGAATCANGSGNVLSDVATLPGSTHVTYVYTATVQSSASELIANSATATVGSGVVDPNPANNSAADTPADVIVIFKDGFDSAGVTRSLDGFSDGAGFVSAQLLVNASLLDGLGAMPVTVATGETVDGRTAFTIELARFNAQYVMRLVARDAQGNSERSEWRAVDLHAGALDFAWQSASAGKDGYLYLAAGAASLQSAARSDTRQLVRLHIALSDETPWLSMPSN
jgi:uncharacterized repeat protein (TIGR01451 family)